MKRILIVCFLFTVLFSTNAKAQCDPWIVKAYNDFAKRAPSAEECKIYHYNNGSWTSYANLVSYIMNYVGPVRGDVWIIQNYVELYNRVPSGIEMNIKLYNNGSWSSYADLKKYIQQFGSVMVSQGITIRESFNTKGNLISAFYQAGKQLSIDEIAAKAGQIIAASAANIVAGGGGNLTVNSVIAATQAGFKLPFGGGASFTGPGVTFGSSYTVQSVGTTTIKTSGTGAMFIR